MKVYRWNNVNQTCKCFYTFKIMHISLKKQDINTLLSTNGGGGDIYCTRIGEKDKKCLECFSKLFPLIKETKIT